MLGGKLCNCTYVDRLGHCCCCWCWWCAGGLGGYWKKTVVNEVPVNRLGSVSPPYMRWVVPTTYRCFSAVFGIIGPILLLQITSVPMTLSTFKKSNEISRRTNRKPVVGGRTHPPHIRRECCAKLLLTFTARASRIFIKLAQPFHFSFFFSYKSPGSGSGYVGR